MTQSSPVTVRRARPEDEPHIREFTQNTFSWGDYVPDAFGEWLEQDVDLWVAVVDGLPQAVCCVDYPTPEEAWFQGIRVNPKKRRMGIATILTQHCAKGARERGARIARVGIDTDNDKSLALAASMGFRKAALLVEFTSKAWTKLPAEPGTEVRTMLPSDAQAAWALARKDISLLGTHYGEWFSASPENLLGAINKGLVEGAFSGDGALISGALSCDLYVEDGILEQEITSFFGHTDGIRSIIHRACSLLTEEAVRRGGVPHQLKLTMESQSPALEIVSRLATLASPQIVREPEGMLIWEYPLDGSF